MEGIWWPVGLCRWQAEGLPGRVGMGGVIPSPEVKDFQAEPLQERSGTFPGGLSTKLR